MDSKYQANLFEKDIYSYWEKEKIFEAVADNNKKPFCIVLPPPNANADLHAGHAMMVYEDIMIRFHKVIGDSTFFVAGADHAGFETQYVYEKHLAKQGKSRFDFDRETLYKNVWDFVMQNKSKMENQLKRLGFSLDWSRKKFTLDAQAVELVYDTFERLYKENLVYRSDRLVNYCTHCGTSFSDLEIVNKEMEGILYYIKYSLKEGGNLVVATTRPETMYGDVAVMVNPNDKRYKKYIGKTVVLPIVEKEIPLIADTYVDKKFGTGVVKVTPAHDINDFEVGKRHKLSYKAVIGFSGRMENTGVVDGLKTLPAREETVQKLEKLGLLEKTVKHKMVIKTCYRCGRVLEPLPKEQWYIRIKPLADKAITLVKDEQIQIFPKRFKRQLIRILQEFIDWNISRQVVWGIRIPAYQCKKKSNNECQTANGWFVNKTKPEKCPNCGSLEFEQDKDTFDTWFSSAQWPFITLTTSGEKIYDYFYPTAVMETGYDILRAWVARMIMIGYFVTNKVPFKTIFLHGMVRDKKGQKMSKSKGNVINPLEMVDKYGADALRAALVFGTKEGNDVVLSEEKIIGMRNFANKMWNIGRFLYIGSNGKDIQPQKVALPIKHKKAEKLFKEYLSLNTVYKKNMSSFKFSKAFEKNYQFLWHRFADYYIEELKQELKDGNIEVLNILKEVYLGTLKMLHPFMPFVTEALWKVFYGQESSILKN